MGSQHVQQPHQELPIGSSLSSSAVLAELLPGHSRNSSGTSHSGSGSASGYGSLASQSQHSRQSSSGELGHFRSVWHGHHQFRLLLSLDGIAGHRMMMITMMIVLLLTASPCCFCFICFATCFLSFCFFVVFVFCCFVFSLPFLFGLCAL